MSQRDERITEIEERNVQQRLEIGLSDPRWVSDTVRAMVDDETWLLTEITALRAENERLRGALVNAAIPLEALRMVYGDDDFPPDCIEDGVWEMMMNALDGIRRALEEKP